MAVVFTLPNSLLQEPVSQDWPLVYLELLARCPEAEDQQGTAALAALETPKGAGSLSAPLRFRAEETERSARWRPLRPVAPADRKRGKHFCALSREVSQEAPVYHI